MYKQASSPSPLGSQPPPPTCYNCGAADHFMMACPEQARQIPAGLAAARAAQAAQPSDAAGNGQSGYGSRPPKRQKTGPVVTRFPAPPTGPIVTHYAPPPTQASPYAANMNTSYYGTPPARHFQQRPMMQAQSYAPQIPLQQDMHYFSHAKHQAPASTTSQGYVQPTMPSSSQGYDQPAPIMSPAYGQQSIHSIPQYSHLNSYPEGYVNAPVQQPYDYHSCVQYGQQPLVGQSPQTLQSFHGQPQLNGQPMHSYTSYQGPSPGQSYGPFPPAQNSSGIQNWGQSLAVPQAYPVPSYQPGNAQYQKPYQNQLKKRPYQHPPYQAPLFEPRGNYPTGANPSHGPSTPHRGYGPATNSQQFQRDPGQLRAFELSNSHAELTASIPEPYLVDNTNDDTEFQWNLEKSFAEETKKDPDPIGRPLPTVYDEEPILPPAYNSKAIIGKYVRPNNLEIFTRNIRLSLHWPGLRGDPVFHDINFDSPLIPLEDIEFWIQQRQNKLNLAERSQSDAQPSPNLERVCSEEQKVNGMKVHRDAMLESDISRTDQIPQVGLDGAYEVVRPARDVIPTLDRNIIPAFRRSVTPSFGADDDAWAPQPGEGQITTSPVTDPTEALLASLGVSGSPKPLAPKNSAPLTSPVYMDELSRDFYSRGPVRHDSGYASQRGSISHESKNVSDNPTIHGEYRQSYNSSNPPPPPPPPPRMWRQVDGALDSPSSDGSGQFRAGACGSQFEGHSVAHQGSSPLTPNSAEGVLNEYTVPQERKIIPKPAPLRQVDDVTPKLKRRQPKVADAYSRRW